LHLPSLLASPFAHELWAIHPLSDNRQDTSRDIQEMCHSISSRGEIETFRLLAAVCLHGFRSAHLARRTSRHRSLPQRQATVLVPSGLSLADCSLNSGRGQRKSGLASLAGSDLGADLQSQATLRWRRPRCGTRRDRLRLGFDHNRSFLEFV
jgi:hypothetical protein